MDPEKQPLLASGLSSSAAKPEYNKCHSRTQSYSFKRLYPATILLILGFLSLFSSSNDLPTQTSRIYPGEHIAWTPCGTTANRTLECATITVPMDHFNASNNLPDNKHFTIPLIRLRSPNANKTTTKNLLLNPGGPGASGTGFIYERGAQVATLVGDGFHLLSFDPRGVNASRPQASCYSSPESRRELSAVRNKRLPEDSGELWAWTRNFVRACAVTTGVHAGYVNTPQTAADMNLILDAVGQRGLYYWGFSYGTVLGQTYATMFPDRAERVILDGVVNQVDVYEKVLDGEMLTDTDRVLEGFVEECLKAGEERCALAGLASTKEELLEKVVKGVAKLKDDPVAVYVNSTVHGVLDYWAVWHNGVHGALHAPAAWGELATNLAALLRSNATAAFLAYGRTRPWETVPDAYKFIGLNDGKSGPENWPVDRLGLVHNLNQLTNQSLFGDRMYDVYFSKQAWSIPRRHNYVPKSKVKTAYPLLILSTTYDPVCPLVSAKSASEVFEGSRIVEVKGYGHCSPAMPSTCIVGRVRDYLYEGVLPEEHHSQCEADDKHFFSSPEEVIDTNGAQDEKSRQLRLAQQELARDLWPRI